MRKAEARGLGQPRPDGTRRGAPCASRLFLPVPYGRASGRRAVRAVRQLPARADEVAGVPVGVLLQVVLVLGLGLPERAGRRDLGDDLARPQAGGVDVGDGVLGGLLLGVAEVEDGRAVAGADVVALPVE